MLPAGSPSPGQNSAKGVVSIAPVADTAGKGSWLGCQGFAEHKQEFANTPQLVN